MSDTITTAQGRSLTVSKATSARLEEVRVELQELIDDVPLYRNSPARAMDLAARLDTEGVAVLEGLTDEEAAMVRRLRDVLVIEGWQEQKWEAQANRY